MQHIRREVGFDRETFRQEFLVEFLPCLLTHEDTPASVIFKRSTGSAHHLKDLHNGIVDVSVLPAFVVLNAHNDDHITRDGQTPSSFLLFV